VDSKVSLLLVGSSCTASLTWRSYLQCFPIC